VRTWLSIRLDADVDVHAALNCGASAFMLDPGAIDDASARDASRRRARRFLSLCSDSAQSPRAYLRAAPQAEIFYADMAALMQESAARQLLAGAWAPLDRAGAESQRLAARLAVVEATLGLPDGALRVVADIAAPAALFGLGALARGAQRLAALTYDEAALRAALGVGADAAALHCARGSVALAAAAAGVPALIGQSPSDADVAATCRCARAHGFGGIFVAQTQHAAIAAEIFR